MSRKLYKPADDDAIRAWYGKRPAREIADMLGRDLQSVYRRARRLGVASEYNWLDEKQLTLAITKWHPLGWSDEEISAGLQAEYGIAADRHRIGKLRKRIGLPSNLGSTHQRLRVAAKTRQQIEQAGVRSLTELKLRAHASAVERSGWPDTLTLRAAAVASLLWARGPMSRLQICEALGIKNPKRTDPTCNRPGGTVMAELIRAGLAMSLPRALPGKRRGQSTNIYLLAPGVKPNAAREHSVAS